MSLFDELRTLEEIERAMDKLLSIKSSAVDAYDQMLNIIINDLHPIPFPMIDLVPGYDYSHVYRTRRNNKNEVFKAITELASIGNVDKILKYGRCNTPNQSTFYSSENRPTSNMEVLDNETLNNSDYVILTNGRWLIKKRLKMALLIHSEKALVENPFLKVKYDEFQTFLTNEAHAHIEVVNKLLSFFSNYFSRPFNENNNDEYKLSAAFYNYIIMHCDGLIYPSVKIVYEGLNYAFPHEKFLDASIEFNRGLITVLKKNDQDESFSDLYSTEDRGIMKEVNYIRWNDRSLPYNALELDKVKNKSIA